MVIISSFRAPESQVRLEEKGIRALLDKKDLGVGTLYVSERSLCWRLDDGGDKGFSIDYFQITLHAISKNATVYPTDCIYVLTDCHFTLPDFEDNQQNPATNGANKANRDGGDTSDSESEPPNVSEIVLAPENEGMVPMIYETIKVCQELNPDPNDVDDEEDNMFVDAEDVIEQEDGNDSDDYDHAVEANEINGDHNVDQLREMMEAAVVHNPPQEEQHFEDAD